MRLDPATGKETVLVRADLTDDSSFTASADGAEIWFSSLVVRFQPPAEPRTVSDLFVLDRGSTRVRRVTWNGHLWHPAPSPDGSVRRGRPGRGSVQPAGLGGPAHRRRAGAVLPLAGERAVPGAVTGRHEGGVHPQQARDAGPVRRRPPGPEGGITGARRGRRDAAVADVNADLARAVLGPDPFGEYSPSFMDNGRILFSSDRSGSLCLYVADLAIGPGFPRVQEDPVGAIAAVSDGTTLTYTSYAGHGVLPEAGRRLRAVRRSRSPTIPS